MAAVFSSMTSMCQATRGWQGRTHAMPMSLSEIQNLSELSSSSQKTLTHSPPLARQKQTNKQRGGRVGEEKGKEGKSKIVIFISKPKGERINVE